MEGQQIVWRTREFKRTPKTTDWFWYVGFLALVFAIGALYLGNFTFAVIIVIGAFTLMLEGSRAPKNERYALTSRGVEIGETLLQYKDIASYGIYEHGENPRLVLETNRSLYRHVLIPLDGISINRIRGFIGNYVAEGDHELPAAEHFAERMGL